MYFDRFDTCEAYYLFATHYHMGGDTSDKIFNRLHKLGFKLSPMISNESDLSENAQEIYANLVENHPDAK